MNDRVPSLQEITPGEDFEVINWLVALFRAGLRLEDKQVVTYNQLVPIPPDDRLFVAVGILDAKPYAGSLSYAPGGGVDGVEPFLLERQSVSERTVFSIHFMSKSNEARRRRAEFTFAISNTLSVQLQERHGFQIARLPIGLVDASSNEGAARLNRYVMTLATLSVQNREGPVDFYDSFAGSPALITQE